MDNTPNVGEIVVLNSGGPNMTVTEIDTFTSDVHCKWFNGKKLETGLFPTATLEKAKEDEGQDPSTVFGVIDDGDGPRLG